MWVIIRPLIHSIKGTFRSNILPYFLIKNMHVFVAVMTDMSDSTSAPVMKALTLSQSFFSGTNIRFTFPVCLE